MEYRQTAERLTDYRRQIATLRQQMHEAQAAAEPEPVQDYRFGALEGEVALSELFGGKRDLFMIHNMGTGCPACTMWADGFNGVLAHLQDRAAFAVSSPDAPEIQAAFKERRGWRFRMVSHQGTSFAADMGYGRPSAWRPGVSVFRLAPGGVVRVSDTGFEPGDDFCTAYHLFDLLPDGPAGWRPKFDYDMQLA